MGRVTLKHSWAPVTLKYGWGRRATDRCSNRTKVDRFKAQILMTAASSRGAKVKRFEAEIPMTAASEPILVLKMGPVDIDEQFWL